MVEIDKFDEIEEILQPSRFEQIGKEFYYISLFRGRVRITKAMILPNYEDVEIIQLLSEPERPIIMRQKGSNAHEERIKQAKLVRKWIPKGDVVIFGFENGKSVYIDSGDDPSGGILELVKAIVKTCGVEKSGGKPTTLRDAFEGL